MPRKLGQHFLASQKILHRIAAEICSPAPELVVEIGPGRGALTTGLLECAGRLVAIEVDPALAAHLREKFAGRNNFTLMEGNVLETDLAPWGSAVFAGNLPYYITSPILDRVLRLDRLCVKAVFLVQKEVALRLAAKPGSRDYGYLTVRTQALAVPELLFNVPPSAFRPPPKVDSAVVRLTPRSTPLIEDPVRFLAFASASFRQKRKNLRNNLEPLYPAIAGQPEARLRAEQMPLEDLIDLWRRVEAEKTEAPDFSGAPICLEEGTGESG